jgi:hypothetical protein
MTFEVFLQHWKRMAIAGSQTRVVCKMPQYRPLEKAAEFVGWPWQSAFMCYNAEAKHISTEVRDVSV